MALQVVEAACEFSPGLDRAEIVIESTYGQGEFPKAFDELNSVDARNLALSYGASRGMGSTRINGNTVGPYPVNGDGVPLDEVRDGEGKALPQTHPKMQPGRYRLTVPVTRPILG